MPCVPDPNFGAASLEVSEGITGKSTHDPQVPTSSAPEISDLFSHFSEGFQRVVDFLEESKSRSTEAAITSSSTRSAFEDTKLIMPANNIAVQGPNDSFNSFKTEMLSHLTRIENRLELLAKLPAEKDFGRDY